MLILRVGIYILASYWVGYTMRREAMTSKYVCFQILLPNSKYKIHRKLVHQYFHVIFNCIYSWEERKYLFSGVKKSNRVVVQNFAIDVKMLLKCLYEISIFFAYPSTNKCLTEF